MTSLCQMSPPNNGRYAEQKIKHNLEVAQNGLPHPQDQANISYLDLPQLMDLVKKDVSPAALQLAKPSLTPHAANKTAVTSNPPIARLASMQKLRQQTQAITRFLSSSALEPSTRDNFIAFYEQAASLPKAEQSKTSKILFILTQTVPEKNYRQHIAHILQGSTPEHIDQIGRCLNQLRIYLPSLNFRSPTVEDAT